MQPFNEITRLLRCGVAARSGQFLHISARRLSSSTQCLQAAKDARPPEHSDSPETSQTVSSDELQNDQKKMGRGPAWTVDDRVKLRNAYKQGMTIKAIAELFPTRSFSGVAYQCLWLSRNESEFVGGRSDRVPWSVAEKELLQRLDAEGASRDRILAHFPSRAYWSISGALKRHARSPRKSGTKDHKNWSAQETKYLTESALQGVDAPKIAEALGRSTHAVYSRAARISGFKFGPTVNAYTSTEKEKLLQMRGDGFTFKAIAEALGRSLGSVTGVYYCHRPNHDAHIRRNLSSLSRLTLDELRTISSLRDKKVP